MHSSVSPITIKEIRSQLDMKAEGKMQIKEQNWYVHYISGSVIPLNQQEQVWQSLYTFQWKINECSEIPAWWEMDYVKEGTKDKRYKSINVSTKYTDPEGYPGASKYSTIEKKPRKYAGKIT